MDLIAVAEVGAAGGLGAAVRHAAGTALAGRTPAPLVSPTLLINVSGSFLLGLLTGLVTFHAAPSTLTLVAGTGFCGGYTTFSSASVEAVRSGRQLTSAGLAVASAVAAAAVGLEVGSW